MSATPNLGLALLETTEWQRTFFKDFITALSANDGKSNMALIDAAIGKLQNMAPRVVQVTLSADGWGDEKSQTVAAAGVLSDTTSQLLIPSVEQESDEISSHGVRLSGQQENHVIFTCDSVPSNDIVLWIVIVGIK